MSKQALIVCDMQPDLLASIPTTPRQALLDLVHVALDVARQAKWCVVFTGVQFPAGYQGVPAHHKIYGGLKRLHDSGVGNNNNKAKWFLETEPGAQIETSLLLRQDATSPREQQNREKIIWRQRHLRSPQLLGFLREHGITAATVVGIKAAYAVQATCQALCDTIEEVSVVHECVQDDVPARLDAVLQHVLPIFANDISLTELVDRAVGLDHFCYDDPPTTGQAKSSSVVQYLANCGRGGHGPIFMSHLLENQSWCTFPRQPWYTDTKLFLTTGGGKTQYYCPLGKRVLDFCDEPQFSRICMFLKGREWLDEKEKLTDLAGDLLPETFLIRKGQYFVGDSRPPPPDDCVGGPWFIKDVEKNGGRGILICRHASECLGLVDPRRTYVVQKHIDHPQLTSDGRKCHLKFYCLLICENKTWSLYCYQDSFLSESPNIWSHSDLSPETQITVRRDKMLRFGVDDKAETLPWSFDACQSAVARVVRDAIRKRRLLDRPNQKQFELFSADFMLDTSGRLWLIEFNFSPVLYDPGFFDSEESLTTPGLRAYHDRYRLEGERAQVNDRPMIRDAISLVFDSTLPGGSRWKRAEDDFQ